MIYVGVTAFVALFGYVYELFGHGVHSRSMELAFVIPLGLGCIIYAIFSFLPIKDTPSFVTQNIYNFGVAMLTCGSIYRGVIEIFGSEKNLYYTIYIIIGLIGVGVGIILYGIGLIVLAIKKSKQSNG